MSQWLTALWSGGKGAKGRKVPWSAVAVSVLAHVLILLGAAYLTVLVIAGRQKVMFDAKQPPSIPARKLEHSIRVKQMQQQVRKPQILERLVSQAPSAVALPELPKMEAPDMKNVRDTPMMTARAGNLLGSLGREGGGAGRGLTGGSGYSDTKFFGENIRTRAICILIDVTQTVINKGLIPDLTREASTMLEGLGPDTKFNILAFVDGVESFDKRMVFATQGNKKKALEWINAIQPNKTGNKSGFSGSTPFDAIKLATEMGCDTMFIITDDDMPNIKVGTAFTGTPVENHDKEILDFVKAIETNYGRRTKIGTIIYKPGGSSRGKTAIDFYKKVALATGATVKDESGKKL